jgi:aldehyde dehydrogenase (NAD+)
MSTSTSSDISKSVSCQAYFEEKAHFFQSGATRPYAFRKLHLKKLKGVIKAYEQEISKALYLDLHKPDYEAYSSEIALLYMEIDHALKHLKRWMKPKRVSTSIVHFPSRSKIISVPLGVSLIIAPWNYPFQLLISPLIGAIAAGNVAVLKPSELTPHTAKLIEQMMEATFDRQYISVVQGKGAEVVPALMDAHRFDHIFFTGSMPVGKKIAELAARKLTPVTLELGGKSPAIVDHTTDLKIAARRIAWGKCFNAGQTCISPDYLLVEESVKSELVKYLQNALQEFYPNLSADHPDYAHILNEKRFDTLSAYLKQGRILYGGQTDRAKLFIAPTLMDQVAVDSPLMNEEIFGPILPILTFQHDHEIIEVIRQNPNPLSLYLFTKDKTKEKMITESIAFGGGAINNTLAHFANPNLSFGGIGNSGYGRYHGKSSFDTFTHQKSIIKKPLWYDNQLLYAPYHISKKKLAKWIIE